MMKKNMAKVSEGEKIHFCGSPLIAVGVQNKRDGGKNWVGCREMISLIRNGPYCDISEPLG